MNKKEIQRKRMMSYFIEATNKIIEEEGIENVTIRKVSDLAGYNSATLYNYFDNLDHLIFFACMKYMREYISKLPEDIGNIKKPMDKYYLIWKAFATYSFIHPKIYFRIFFDRFSNSLNDTIRKYYDIFPEELGKQSTDLMPMLLGQNIYDRNMYILKAYFPNKEIDLIHLQEINEMNILIYQGMLAGFLNNQAHYSVEEGVQRLLLYMKKTIDSYLKSY